MATRADVARPVKCNADDAPTATRWIVPGVVATGLPFLPGIEEFSLSWGGKKQTGSSSPNNKAFNFDASQIRGRVRADVNIRGPDAEESNSL